MISVILMFLIFRCIFSHLNFTCIWLIKVEFSFDDFLKPITILLIISVVIFLVSRCYFFLRALWILGNLDQSMMLDILLAVYSIKIIFKLHGQVIVLRLRDLVYFFRVYAQRKVQVMLTLVGHVWKTVTYIISAIMKTILIVSLNLFNKIIYNNFDPGKAI